MLAGDTGCGKSTLVPQFMLSEYGRVACTQPRRLAAVSLARRVSIEGNGEHGVGHQIRFESRAAPTDRIVFMTEGVMLRHIAGGAKGLDDFDVIVLDEVHERHTSTDVLLGTMRGLLARRPALRLVLMSATLHLELFSGSRQIAYGTGTTDKDGLCRRLLADASISEEALAGKGKDSYA